MEEILVCCELSPTNVAIEFHKWKPGTLRNQMITLFTTKRWLRSEWLTATEMVAISKILRSLSPTSTRHGVSQNHHANGSRTGVHSDHIGTQQRRADRVIPQAHATEAWAVAKKGCHTTDRLMST